ncbi:MAG: hypothetical protein R2762_04250 [Bryobacteraceae bacterium]
MRLHVEPRANRDQPVAFDLVAVRSRDLAAALLKMKAVEWFAKKEQIRSDYPGKGDLDIRSWEWVPGQAVGELPVHLNIRPRATFLFALYQGGGENRARVEPGEWATVVLGPDKMTVSGSAHRLTLLKRP